MRRFYRPRFRKPRFRRKQRVSWLTNPQITGQEALNWSDDPSTNLTTIPLQTLDNDWMETHPKFAKRNDITPLKRIVGRFRIGMYCENIEPVNVTDFYVWYGLCIIKGDYDDAGTWTAHDVPRPDEPSDQDDKWLYQDFCILARDAQFGNYGVHDGVLCTVASAADAAAWTGPIRQVRMSTDEVGPQYSYLDIHSRRKTQYAERLYAVIVIKNNGGADANVLFYADWHLRLLVGG